MAASTEAFLLLAILENQLDIMPRISLCDWIQENHSKKEAIDYGKKLVPTLNCSDASISLPFLTYIVCRDIILKFFNNKEKCRIWKEHRKYLRSLGHGKMHTRNTATGLWNLHNILKKVCSGG